MNIDFYALHNIDKSSLSRDYLSLPLRYREKPLKDDLIYLYIKNNLFHCDVAQYFNVNVRTLTKWLKFYDIKKPNELKRTNINKTNVQKYGVENIFQTKDFKEKREKHYIKKYGVKCNQLKHIPLDVLEIIQDKDKLETFIKENNIINCQHLATTMHISEAMSAKIIKGFDLQHLFDYSQSLPEKEIRDYINQHYQTENNTKKYLNGKEIDIYIPSLKMGVEFNGNHWHNEYVKDKGYHQQKSLLAEENGLFIYHIFEYEWNTKKKQILNQLNNLLGINQEKIYARKCIIKEVPNDEKSQFLEDNHMQGNDSSSIKLGLYYNDELVSLMTFVKPRFNNNYEYELSRFCSKANCNVIGGASKLWKCFINQYKPTSVISYSNIAHTKGLLYQTLGFTLQSISDPNYIWFKNNRVLSRYQCQKHKLLEMGFEGNSETNIMKQLGYYRIYDCGNKVWIWNNKKDRII